MNNVEVIQVKNAKKGAWTITVIGSNVAAGPQASYDGRRRSLGFDCGHARRACRRPATACARAQAWDRTGILFAARGAWATRTASVSLRTRGSASNIPAEAISQDVHSSHDHIAHLEAHKTQPLGFSDQRRMLEAMPTS